MSEDIKRLTRLQPLSGSDFEMADKQPDIRNWVLKDSSGKRFGKVDELIFDLQSLKVRYIVADLGRNDFELENRKVLIPIGIAELHKEDDDVILPVTVDQLNVLPEYNEERFDADHENSIRNVLGTFGAPSLDSINASGNADGFYDHDHFNEDNLFRNRAVKDSSDDEKVIPVITEELEIGKHVEQTGRIKLRSRIVERDVSEDITLKNEAVKIERTPVDREASASDYKEQEIEVSEHAEVPVVNRTARVVEEVSLNKEVTEKNEIIKDSVCDTIVEIEKKDETSGQSY